MSVKTIITCDHCGAELSQHAGSRWQASFHTIVVDDVHGCNKYHLALGTAKALGLDISPKLAELQAQLDAANARSANLEERLANTVEAVQSLAEQRDALAALPDARPIEPESAAHAFDGDLVKRLAEVQFAATQRSREHGGIGILPWDKQPGEVRNAYESGIRAVLAELVKTAIELPSAQSIAIEYAGGANEWTARDLHCAETAVAVIRTVLAPVLAAKDARIADLETAAKMHEAALARMPANEVKSSEREQYEITIERLNGRIDEMSEDLKREKENHFLAREELRRVVKERDDARARIAELEKQLASRPVNQYPTPKTPEQLEKANKPFPGIGQIWRFLGSYMAPPTSDSAITGLRWFYGRAEAVFGDGTSVAGFEHLMECDAWECVQTAPASPIAAKALADLRETITHDDDPSGYFAGKINAAIEQLQAPKDANGNEPA